jgi:hypothetical protein
MTKEVLARTEAGEISLWTLPLGEKAADELTTIIVPEIGLLMLVLQGLSNQLTGYQPSMCSVTSSLGLPTKIGS